MNENIRLFTPLIFLAAGCGLAVLMLFAPDVNQDDKVSIRGAMNLILGAAAGALVPGSSAGAIAPFSKVAIGNIDNKQEGEGEDKEKPKV